MSVREEPREPGLVAFEVEVVPHFAGSNGQGWHAGTLPAEDVAAILRDYAEQVEGWTSDRCEVAFDGYYEPRPAPEPRPRPTRRAAAARALSFYRQMREPS